MNRKYKAIFAVILSTGVMLTAKAAQPTQAAVPPVADSESVQMPEFRLTTMGGETIDSAKYAGKAFVLIYVVAKQRGSERAIVEASQIVKDLDGQPIELLFVTAKADQREYFEQFWKENSIAAPLLIDEGRELYAQLGLIVFPSTMIVDRKGKIIHKIPTYSVSYSTQLDGYARFAMGLIDEAGLEERLKAQHLPLDSSKSLAARHRTVARLMREKGYLDAAEKELLSALELDPKSVEARLDLADLYITIRRLDEADEILHQIRKIDGHNRRVLLLKGILQFRNNQLDEAEKSLTQVLVLNPDPARAHFYLGRVFEAQGNKDQALTHYREALTRLLDEPMD